MTRVRVRTRPSEVTGPADIFLLDWFDSAGERTVECTGSLFDRAPRLTALGEDLLRFGGSVYCADRVVRRDRTPDRWRREISLELGVTDRDRWKDALPDLTEALEFLSGDRWRLVLRRSAGGMPRVARMKAAAVGPAYDAVCLFSGGLDSLCGAIGLLDAGARVALVGHHENGLASKRQKTLAEKLAGQYGADHARLLQIHLGPATWSSGQARRLPKGGERDSTFRARSALFIAAGLCVADAVGPDVPLFVPENGFIGINVPLRPTRAGSLSTRTTHPWFMDRLERAFRKLGFCNPIENPFRTQTKGEVIQGVKNAALLGRLIPTSLSCAHPESLFRFGISPRHCGYCFPCMIRRAGLSSTGVRDRTRYEFNAVRDKRFLNDELGRAADPLAVLASLRRQPGRFDVLRNGPIFSGDVADFADVYLRGREELRAWVERSGLVAVRAKAAI